MIRKGDIEKIAEGWVREFSADPQVKDQREMIYWHQLDKLVYKAPLDALRVFESIAKKELIEWTFEGLAAGPLRTFLMLYDSEHNDELLKIRTENTAFNEMYTMALEGLE